MSYVILQVALTLDGYISRKDDSVDFLDAIDNSFVNHFNSFINSIDTIFMGSKTYEVMLSFGDIPYQNKKIYVCTTKNYETKNSNITFTSKPLKDLINGIDGNIWLFGGARLIQSFMKENLVDELQLFIVPKTIGIGIPLFYDHDHFNNWSLISHENFADNLYVVYKKRV
jgi:dihydrofolate reductase